jgi:hypothetical protein
MTNQEENKFQSVSPNSTTQAPILLAAKKSKQNNSNQDSNQDSNQVTPDPDRYKQKSSKQLCQNLLNDVDALLNGGGKEVNNPNDYKIMGRSLLPDGEPAIKTSIAKRIQDLKDDFKNLYNNKPEGKDSYKGHQDFVKAQQTALQKALTNLKDKCKNFTAEEQALIDRAEEAVKIPIPQKPDSELRQNSANTSSLPTTVAPTSALDKVLDRLKRSLPVAKADEIINGIKNTVAQGKDYWDKQGRQQVIDTLTTIAKLPVALVVIIVAAIATAMGFDSPLKVEAGSTDKIASTAGNNTANTSQTPVTPSSTALTGTITGGTSQTARTSTSTALTGIAAGSSPTALTGIAAGSSPTALTGIAAGGENPQPTQLQQGLTLS